MLILGEISVVAVVGHMTDLLLASPLILNEAPGRGDKHKVSLTLKLPLLNHIIIYLSSTNRALICWVNRTYHIEKKSLKYSRKFLD